MQVLSFPTEPNYYVCLFCTELYESTEYSAVTIDETWSQQLIRISQAILFSAAQMGTQLFATVGIPLEDPKENDQE